MAAVGLLQTLLLLSALLYTALTAPASDVVMEAGQDVVIPCEEVVPGQRSCNGTTWLYKDPRSTTPALQLYSLGKVKAWHKIQTFSLMENCSLSIHGVQMKEAGLYSCLQFHHSGRQASKASVALTVVKVSQYVDHGAVEQRCLVSSPHRCPDLGLKWLLNGTELGPEHPSSVSAEFPCEAVVSVPRPQLDRAPRTELFTCELTRPGRRYSFKPEPQPRVLAKVFNVFVRAPSDAVLTCGSVQDGQQRCDRTTWEYRYPESSQAQLLFGSSEGGVTFKEDLSQFNLTENCSLEIKKVTASNLGYYTCRQFNALGQEVSVGVTDLSVVLLNEEPRGDTVRVASIVLSPHSCDTFLGRWLYNGSSLTAEQYMTRQGTLLCFRIVSFTKPYFNTLQKELLLWEISHRDQKHAFTIPSEPVDVNFLLSLNTAFIPADSELPEARAGITATPTDHVTEQSKATPTDDHVTEQSKATSEENCEESGGFEEGWWYLVLKAVGCSTLIFVVVLVSIYTSIKETALRRAAAAQPMALRPRPRNTDAQDDYVNQQ